MSRVPLSPVARPVNTFAPETVQRPAEGNKWIDLAASLSRLEPSLHAIEERRHVRHVEGEQRRADEAIAKHQLRNMEQFRGAVKRGEIEQSTSPWFRVAIEKNLALIEADDTFRDVERQFETSPARHTDGDTAASEFFDTQTAGLLQNRSKFELAALAPAIVQARSSFLNRHHTLRSGERVVEHKNALHLRLSQALANGTPADEVNGIVQEAGLTLHWPEVNKIAKDAVLSHAYVTRDADFAEKTLGAITTPGGNLAQTADTKLDIQQLRDRIDDEAYQEEVQAERRRNAQLDRDSRSLVGVLTMKMDEARKQGADPRSVALTMADAVQDPELREAALSRVLVLENQRNALRGMSADEMTDADRERLSEIDRQLLALSPTDPDYTTKARTLKDILFTIRGGEGVLDKHEQRERVLTNHAEQNRRADPFFINELWTRLKAGKLTADYIIQHADRFAHPGDEAEWIARMHQNEGGSANTGAPTAAELDKRAVSEIGSRIAIAAKVRGEEIGQDTDTADSVAFAENRFHEGMEAWHLANPSATPIEEAKARKEMIDTIVAEQHGLSVDEWRKHSFAGRTVEQLLAATPVATPPAPKDQPEPIIAMGQQLDPVLKAVDQADLKKLDDLRDTVRVPLGQKLPEKLYEPGERFDVKPDENIWFTDTTVHQSTSTFDTFSQLRRFRQHYAEYRADEHPAAMTEIQLRTALVAQRRTLAAEMPGVVKEFESHMAKIKQAEGLGISPPFSTFRRATELADKMQFFSHLSREVGLDAKDLVDDAKSQHPRYPRDAWRSFPLFTNNIHLQQSRRLVAAQLIDAGLLDEKEYATFNATQQFLTESRRLLASEDVELDRR